MSDTLRDWLILSGLFLAVCWGYTATLPAPEHQPPPPVVDTHQLHEIDAAEFTQRVAYRPRDNRWHRRHHCGAKINRFLRHKTVLDMSSC